MNQQQYIFKKIEAEIQQQWAAADCYRTIESPDQQNNQKKFYCVSMCPYPSGKLHMGHVRNYTLNDVMVRYLRMQGYKVLMPMGWDAFGMPAENAALAHKMSPAAWTYQNIAQMKKQMQAMGLAIDWSREIATCQPEYYRWNQWLFLKMLEKGIAYQKKGVVNWDPVDATVLANEQVIEGRGWRSGALVEKREISMYYLRITDYAQVLLDDLETLEWPERVKVMQKNWIGKSQGVRVGFPYQIDGKKQALHVFTTRVDTLMGVTFCAIAAQHPLAQRLAQQNSAVQAYIDACIQGSVAEADLALREKTGIATGFCVQHPLTQQPIEVWISNYVLMHYGEGAVMGVPAHDERDFAFAQKYQLPIKQVIQVGAHVYSAHHWQSWYADAESGVCVESGRYSGKPLAQARAEITSDLQAIKWNDQPLGVVHTQFRLRDWGISRQRYWGTPIPIIHCVDCGAVPVPEQDLPVILPEQLIPQGGGNPLSQCSEFLNCFCPQCGKAAQRETDTMDTFVDSAWYFLRYPCVDALTITDWRSDYWMPMDQYIGGIEHAILHLLYARFWIKVMRDLKLTVYSEPATRLLTQGMVLNATFYRTQEKGRKIWFNPQEVKVSVDAAGQTHACLLADQQPVAIGAVEKMSKSKNNGVDPQQLIDQYGADTARLFVIFAAPAQQQLEWSAAGVEGSSRFLKRLWAFAQSNFSVLKKIAVDTDFADPSIPKLMALKTEVNNALKQIHFDYQRVHYNTVVSSSMKILNALEAAEAHFKDDFVQGCSVIAQLYTVLLRVLYPIVPHITTYLWQALDYQKIYGTLLDAEFPQVDHTLLAAREINWVLQINGKVRGQFCLPQQATPAFIEQTALQQEAFVHWAAGKAPKKVIIVPGRLVNIVL